MSRGRLERQKIFDPRLGEELDDPGDLEPKVGRNKVEIAPVAQNGCDHVAHDEGDESGASGGSPILRRRRIHTGNVMQSNTKCKLFSVNFWVLAQGLDSTKLTTRPGGRERCDGSKDRDRDMQ